MKTQCRIRRLKIRSDDRVNVPRFTFMLEDALRTASFPGLPPNGMVLIRAMDLGPLNARINSREMSNRIDRWIQTIRPTPVEDPSPPPDDTPAVWFADELAPYRLLTEQLAKGHHPRAWFWHAAVRGWSAHRPLTQNLEEIMGHVARMPTGIVGLAHVLAPLREKAILLDLLAACKPEQLCEVLFFSGFHPRPSPAPARLPKSPGRARLRKAAARDGLLTQEPSSLVAKAIHRWGIVSPATRLITALELAFNALTVSDRSVDRILIGVAEQSGPQAERSGRETSHVTAAADHGHLSKNAPADMGSGVRRSEVEKSVGFPGSIKTDALAAVSRLDHQDAAPTEAVHHPQLNWGATAHPGNASVYRFPDDRHTTGRDRKDLCDVAFPEQVYPSHPFAGRFTRFAGFPLLVNVLARIGIETIFQDLPESPSEFAMDALRQAFLWRIAEWQKIPRDDPARQCLGDPQEIFKVLEKATFSISRKAILEKAPDNRRALFSPPLSRNPSAALRIGQLIDVLVIAACRYVHRKARMTVPRMIRRPAFIAITPNHMDITAALATLDIRLRMAGLDVDPGWVPWLKRVIRLHYSEDRN